VPRPSAVSCLLALLLVGSLLAVGPVVGVAASDTQLASDVSSSAVVVTQQATPANNTTVRQEDPDTVGEDGDLGQVESTLARTLASRLGESSIQISEGQYDQARRLLGDDYDRDLGKYVDVAGETGSEGTADRFEQASTQTREYGDAVESYRETREEYREARANGNTERARALARELQRDGDRVNRTASDLTDIYGRLANGTGVDFSESIESVETTRTDVQRETERIAETEFTGTRLSVDASETAVSFTDPLRLTGRLTTANGTALDNRSITLRIGEQTATVETDRDGTFSTAYRPTTLPTGARTLTVTYVPASESLFTSSSATVSVRVDAVTPKLQVSSATDRAGYTESVVATGRVAVDEIGAESVPVALSVDGVRVGSAETAANGTFTVRGRLPATVQPGSQSLTVRIAQPDRAIEAVQTRESITIEQTPTRLSLDATAVNAETVDLSGRLLTASASEEAVPDAVVTVTQNGTAVGTLSTDGTGGFSMELSPESVDGRLVRLTVAFDGSGTNLESATASTQVRLPAASDADDSGSTGESSASSSAGSFSSTGIVSTVRSAPLLVGGALLGVLVLAVAGLLAFTRLRRSESTVVTSGVGEGDGSTTETTQPADSGGPDSPGSFFVAAASERLNAGANDDAVQYAYAGVRAHLAADAGLDADAEQVDTQTHWEFYETASAVLSGEDSSTLQTLTEQFEQATFTLDGVSAEDAERSV
jgi:hypothetical protein